MTCLEWSDQMFQSRECGLEIDRDRYGAKNLAPRVFTKTAVPHDGCSGISGLLMSYAALSPVIDLAAMGHAEDQDEKLFVVDLVHDAVAAGTDPPLP